MDCAQIDSSTSRNRSFPKNISSPTKIVGEPKAPRLTAASVFCFSLCFTSGCTDRERSRSISIGGVVFHDVINVKHARKAAEQGVDGLILVCAGAGGHAGTLSPFALVREVRQWFKGTILLSGAISDGWSIASALALGADLAYMGTRFIATSGLPISKQKSMLMGLIIGVVFLPPWNAQFTCQSSKALIGKLRGSSLQQLGRAISKY